MISIQKTAYTLLAIAEAVNISLSSSFVFPSQTIRENYQFTNIAGMLPIATDLSHDLLRIPDTDRSSLVNRSNDFDHNYSLISQSLFDKGITPTDGSAFENMLVALWMATFGTPIDTITSIIDSETWNNASQDYSSWANQYWHELTLHTLNPEDLHDPYEFYYAAAAGIDHSIAEFYTNNTNTLLNDYFHNWINIFINFFDLFTADILPLTTATFPTEIEEFSSFFPAVNHELTWRSTGQSISVSSLLQHGPYWMGRWNDGNPATLWFPSGLASFTDSPDHSSELALGKELDISNLDQNFDTATTFYNEIDF